MAYVDFLSVVHKSTKRDYVARVTAHDKAECSTIAKAYGRDYWDGERQYGYGDVVRVSPPGTTTGVSGTGSGRLISSPASFASSIARSSRRYWFSKSPGSNSPGRGSTRDQAIATVIATARSNIAGHAMTSGVRTPTIVMA